MRCGSTDRKSTRLNSSHSQISYAVFCLKKKKKLLPGCFPPCSFASAAQRMRRPPVSFVRLIRCCSRHLVTRRLPQSPCRPRGFVKLRVLRGGRLPRKVFVHAVQLDTLPDALVGKVVKRLANGVKQRAAGIV